MAEWRRAASATFAFLSLTVSVLVSTPRVAASANTWTTDDDFAQSGAIFVGTEVVGTGVPARVELMKDNVNWNDMGPTGPPGPREGPGLAASPDGGAVLFGGYDGNDLSDTWEYDYSSNAWTETTADPTPPGREWPGLSYDPAEGVAVPFGGVNNTDGVFLNDTWEYDVATDTWSQQSPPTSPPFLADSPLTYLASAARHVVVGHSLSSGELTTSA